MHNDLIGGAVYVIVSAILIVNGVNLIIKGHPFFGFFLLILMGMLKINTGDDK